MPGLLGLVRLLVRLRWQSMWNAAFKVPRQRAVRVVGLIMAMGLGAYMWLFVTAFRLVAATANRAEQVAFVALAAGVITLSSLTTKMASNEAVVGGSGENEFLLARPVALWSLVVARSLAGVATDVFDALFLFPALAAVSWVWEAGVAGVLLAALTSILVQVGVSAAAQAAQILVVRVVPAARRRLIWSVVALLGALAMVLLWLVVTSILRQPAALLVSLRAWTPLLLASPGGLVVKPIAGLAAGGAAWAALELAAVSAGVVVVAAVIAKWAGRAGWEQAAEPWAESARGPRRGRGAMTLFKKDWAIVVRDRSRLVTLVGLPVIFVGLQIYGLAGWSWTSGSPRHAAVLAFSIAAYMATFGPLSHMQVEKKVFWILRVAPMSLGRILAEKAVFWSLWVGGTAALVGGVLLALGQSAVSLAAVGEVALAVLGAVMASWLAVAMAAGAADFSDDRRALPLGTAYLFLVVEGLFNIVLLEGGEPRLRGLLLYSSAVALHWLAGLEQAESAYDPERRQARRVLASDGATWAILLFLGVRAGRLALGPGTPEVSWEQLVWAALIGVAAAITWWRARRQFPPRWSLAAALGVAAVVGVAAGATAWNGVPLWGGLAMAAALMRALVEEVITRGLVQGSLERRLSPRAAAVLSAALALAASGRPLGAAAFAAALAPALVRSFTGRLSAAVVTRLLIEVVAG